MNTIELTGEEASLLIETTTDALYRRVLWSIGFEGKWRALPLEDVQNYLGALSTLHTKAWMVLRDLDSGILDDFEKAFMIPDIVWDLIDEITVAHEWKDVPRHQHSPSLCQACRVLSHAAANLEV